jgi:hypothetical protein
MQPSSTASGRIESKHVLGPAVYQAQARELAAGNDPGVGDEEIHWALDLRRRQFARLCGFRSQPGSLLAGYTFYQLDVGLRR